MGLSNGTASEGGVGGGGTQGCGTVFSITPARVLTVLHRFNGTDGCFPENGLVQGTDGNFYGSTSSCGTGYRGTIFKMTPDGTLTTLASALTGSVVGALAPASNGGFYGTDNGVLFVLRLNGTLTTLHTFGEVQVGSSGLYQGTNSVLYGTTGAIGSSAGGTIYGYSTGLPPFIATAPRSGVVGTSVIILGDNLTGTTSVTFNGVAAAFTVVSASEITATEPEGTTTGKVQVATAQRHAFDSWTLPRDALKLERVGSGGGGNQRENMPHAPSVSCGPALALRARDSRDPKAQPAAYNQEARNFKKCKTLG